MNMHSSGTNNWRRSGLYLIFSSLMLFVSALGTAQAANANKREIKDFALIGDVPYNGQQRIEFVNMIKALNVQDLAFVVHDGDFWFDGIAWKNTTKGLPPCADETFQDRFNLTKEFKHPFILTPGDNDWTDCYRAKPRHYDPLERLAKLRKMFFHGDKSLGQHAMKLTRESENPRYAKFRENARWSYGGVQFMTLHMIGSNNNLGRTPVMDAEYQERNAANLAWVVETFKQAKANGSKAIMIISQANPFFEDNWSEKLRSRYLLKGLGMHSDGETRKTGFSDFLKVLGEQAIAFGKPVVYVHGDTHTFRIDKPLVVRTAKGTRFIPNVTRVETFGFPNTHWVRVSIDPDDPNVFLFRQEIVQANVPKITTIAHGNK